MNDEQIKQMQQEHQDLIQGAINQRDAYANEGIKLNALVMKLQREVQELKAKLSAFETKAMEELKPAKPNGVSTYKLDAPNMETPPAA